MTLLRRNGTFAGYSVFYALSSTGFETKLPAGVCFVYVPTNNKRWKVRSYCNGEFIEETAIVNSSPPLCMTARLALAALLKKITSS